ncbi:hypothetical protein MTO96_000764 [Rhipicephalus appendiculatus]
MTAGTNAPAASPTPSQSGRLRDTSAVDVPKSQQEEEEEGGAVLQLRLDRQCLQFLALQHAGQPSRTSRPRVPSRPFQGAAESRSKVSVNSSLLKAHSKQLLPSSILKAKLFRLHRSCRMTSSSQDSAASRIRVRGKAKRARPTFAESESGDVGDEVLIVRDTPEPTPLAESDAVMFGRGHETPCGRMVRPREEDLLEALTTSQAQIIINAHSTFTGRLSGQASRILRHGQSCTFVYYKYTDDEAYDTLAATDTTSGMAPPSPAQFQGSMRSASIQHVQQLVFELPKQRKIIGIILIQVAIVIGVIAIAQHHSKRGAVVVYCDTADCVRHAAELSTSVDDSVHPCRSFYGFVCGRWSRTHSRDDLLEEIHSRAVDIALRQLDRDGWQSTKASAFFHSCMDSKLQRHENVRGLVALKRELGLVWPEESHGSDHPLSVMLKMAIQWNLNFLFQVRVVSRRESSRTLFITRGFLGITWEESQEKSLSSYRNHVEEHFKVLDVTPSNVNYTELWQLEDAIIQAKLEVIHKKPAQDWFPIGKIGHRTPSIQEGLWLQLLNKYFRDRYTWTQDSLIAVEHYKILENLEKLFRSYGEDKLAIGLAWVFIQTHLWVLYDKPELQFKRSHVTIKRYACLEYVNLYFGLQSIVDHMVLRYASKETRKKVEGLPDRIKRTATNKIREATWIANDTKENYARKVANIEMSVLPPSDFFTVKGREDIYGIFPAMNSSSSFMANLVTVANFYSNLVSHERYGDIYSRATSATYGPARYVYPANSVLVPMNALSSLRCTTCKPLLPSTTEGWARTWPGKCPGLLTLVVLTGRTSTETTLSGPGDHERGVGIQTKE